MCCRAGWARTSEVRRKQENHIWTGLRSFALHGSCSFSLPERDWPRCRRESGPTGLLFGTHALNRGGQEGLPAALHGG
jgi:hypothetical protein